MNNKLACPNSSKIANCEQKQIIDNFIFENEKDFIKYKIRADIQLVTCAIVEEINIYRELRLWKTDYPVNIYKKLNDLYVTLKEARTEKKTFVN